MSFFNKKDIYHQKQTAIDIIDFGEDLGNCKICICDEGNKEEYPHFHIIGINKDFETAVLLYNTSYYSHCGKYRGWLNENQLIILNDYMTNGLWNKLKKYWNLINPKDKCPISHILNNPPDYTKMIYPESMFYDVSVHILTDIILDDKESFDIIIFENMNGGKGITPHFHLCRKDMSLECSICIFDSKYYSENKSMLNITQKENFTSFLNTTIWNNICDSWYLYNPKSRKIKNKNMPNYLLL